VAKEVDQFFALRLFQVFCIGFILGLHCVGFANAFPFYFLADCDFFSRRFSLDALAVFF
jgi:hypothetical protein